MYQNLSRQYRPQTFQSIMGQEPIVTTLKNAIKMDQIAPAYLFCGCRGTGKTTLARLFAKALNCHRLCETQEPCNKCPSCTEIIQGRSLDVHEIDGASNRGIDDIRQINDTIGYSTAGGKYKIYVIDEVHMLTKEAFNALLKTLEEPPNNVRFFFATTEPHKVLPTIMSRCQRFDLKRLTTDQIVKKLQAIRDDLKLSVEDAALELIAYVAEGSLRDAESVFDQLLCYREGLVTYDAAAQILGVTPRNFYFKLDEAIEKNDLSAAFELSHNLFSSGKELHTFLEGLLEHFRTHLLMHYNLPPQSYLHAEEEKYYRRMPALFSEDHLLYILDYLTEWIKELNKIPFRRITLEMIFLHLIRSMKRISLPSLIRRLEELSSENVAGHPPKPIKPPENILPQTPVSPGPSRAENTLSRPQSYYDNMLRFAAVELEGILKKD
ncbi:MAG: DNA polymerase III subunit gamma/tau [Rhabdochlamydiaceae bacterium]